MPSNNGSRRSWGSEMDATFHGTSFEDGRRAQPCDHLWCYAGVRYELGHRLPGSSAREVLYFDAYFCQRCLERTYVRTTFTGSSYDQILFGATPKEG